jgi:hypothetical protein
MSRSDVEIVQLLADRKAEQGPLLAAARSVQATYNGDLTIPLPELDRDEKKAVPNLLQQGLNQMSMRIASTMPDIYYPPEKPGEARSESYARIRRQANLGWWQASNIKILMGRRARHLLGYATSPVMVRPDFKKGIPAWELRHPLRTFPGPVTNPDDCNPLDNICTYDREMSWLQRNWPVEFAAMKKPTGWKLSDKVEILDYQDTEEHVLIVLGPPETDNFGRTSTNRSFVRLGDRLRNLAGVCTVVVPGRITLDRRMGAYDGMVGLYQRQAKMMALEVIAVQRGIFANEWLVSRPNENATIVQQADGLRGVMGVVRGGEITTETLNPGYRTDQTIGELERAQRLEGGIPAEFGGESGTNIRTGRRGDSILSAVVDFPIQEAQHIFEASLEQENRVAVAVAKAYFGEQKKSFYVSLKGGKGVVDYTPNKHFTTDFNTVNYSHAGADINSLIVGIGQMIGVGLISRELGRELNPMIDDPEQEKRRTIVEGLEMALMAGLQQGVTTGVINPADLARMMSDIETGRVDLAEAVVDMQRHVQELQATAGPPGTPAGPVAPGAPEAQPGIAPPGNSGEAGTAIGPSEDVQGLGQLNNALRAGARGA